MPPESPSRQRKFVRGALLAGLAVLLIGALALVWNYPPTENSFYPKCTLHRVTGLHCPGCGLTRSVYSVLHGEFVQALAYNVLSPILLPLLIFGLAKGLWENLRASHDVDNPKPSRAVPKWLIWGSVIVLIAFGILRNIPVYPLSLLAPHELGE